MNVPVVHYRHSIDGYPLCWPMSQEGEFVATEVDDEVNCRACMKYLEDE